MHIFKNPNFDFVRWKWHAIALSWVIIISGLLVIWKNGMPKGVEFSGGTIVIVKFAQAPDLDRVRTILPGGGTNAIVQTYGVPSANEVMIRVHTTGSEVGQGLSQTVDTVVNALNQANLGPIKGTLCKPGETNCLSGTRIVGPTVGAELQQRGILATVFALAGILVYIAFRFRFSFAVGAVVATIHDLLVTLAFLVIFQYDMSLNVIAAILTITGFSTNDTIVIFDRIRENLRSMRRDSLGHVINVSINQTLGRTIITSGTAFLTALALFVFGGEVLHGFAFTMVVGILTGTYSSVFIAAAIISFWRGAAPTRAAAHAPASSSPAAPQQPTRKVKPQRKARAS